MTSSISVGGLRSQLNLIVKTLNGLSLFGGCIAWEYDDHVPVLLGQNERLERSEEQQYRHNGNNFSHSAHGNSPFHLHSSVILTRAPGKDAEACDPGTFCYRIETAL